MSKLYDNATDAEAQLKRLAEAGIEDRWLVVEAGLFRVVWYV